MQILNAKITSTMLGFEDHGVMTFFLNMEFEHSNQGFGGCCICNYDHKTNTVKTGDYGMACIISILKALDVDKWEQVKGQLVRIKKGDGWNDRVEAVGHIIKDQWFDLKETAIRYGLK